MKATYYWREVETGDANRLEFRLGGERIMVYVAIASLAVILGWGLTLMWHIVQKDLLWLADARSKSGQAHHPEWSLLLVDAFFVAVWVPLAVWQGIFMIIAFRRGELIVNRMTFEITKTYRLVSLRAHRTYDARTLSSISFGWETCQLRFLGFLGFHAIRLHMVEQKVQRLVLIPWTRRKEGRELAEKIAAFLKVSGPTNCVEVK